MNLANWWINKRFSIQFCYIHFFLCVVVCLFDFATVGCCWLCVFFFYSISICEPIWLRLRTTEVSIELCTHYCNIGTHRKYIMYKCKYTTSTLYNHLIFSILHTRTYNFLATRRANERAREKSTHSEARYKNGKQNKSLIRCGFSMGLYAAIFFSSSSAAAASSSSPFVHFQHKNF